MFFHKSLNKKILKEDKMRKTIYLLFIITVIAVAMVSCADNTDNNLSRTGLIDQNGNILTNTLVYTNVIQTTNTIEVWMTNGGIHMITTNADGSIRIEYVTNVLAPNIPDKATDYYKIRVPFGVSGDGYTTVSYKDTNKLKQLWLDQINRKANNDGKVFAIRNKANNRDFNNFQNKHTHDKYSAEDYYYFNNNGDIVWKEDNTIIKKFVGAIITGYRDIAERRFGHWEGRPSNYAIIEYKWKQKGIYTVGAIYANTLTTDEAREKYFGRQKTGGVEDFESGNNPFKDGVYDFVAYRYRNETFNNGLAYAANLFERQYINPGFIEVLVMYDYDNMGYSGAAGLHSYYAYYGIYDYYKEYKNHPGIYFTPENMPYMTNQNIYLGERPEHTIPLLTHSAAFTDNPRDWYYLFMPGRKN